MKRIFDILLASFGLIFSLPLWFLFGLAVYFEDRGPVFYYQDRVGKKGKIFKIMKFRSMGIGAEEKAGPLQAKENDERVTKIGKILRVTAMDEMPQLLNIFKGDMSFVGPKALRPFEIDSNEITPKAIWDFEGFSERCKVKPGLTGIAQIFAPRDIPRNQKFKYDIWYIKNQNFFLDAYLIFLSFMITFKGKWESRQRKISILGERLKERIEKEICS